MSNFIKLLLVNILLVAVLLLPADLLFGYVSNNAGASKTTYVRRSVNLREWPPNLDGVRRPKDGEIAVTDGLVQRDYVLRTDRNGFIVGPEQSLASESADIIFFGGSTTECLYVDEAARFPFLVGQLLESKDTAESLLTLNSGVSGSHSFHSSVGLLAKGLKMNPRIVVLMNNVNDLSLLIKTGSYWRAPATRAIVADPRATAKAQQIALNQIDQPGTLSKLSGFLYPNLTAWIGARFGTALASVDEWDGFRFEQSSVDLQEMSAAYRESLQRFVNIARASGIEVVLMTQFNRIRLNDEFTRRAYEERGNSLPYDDFVAAYTRFNEVVREVALANNVLLIDLAAVIPADSRHIYDPAHVTNYGSQAVARVIAESLHRQFDWIELRQ